MEEVHHTRHRDVDVSQFQGQDEHEDPKKLPRNGRLMPSCIQVLLVHLYHVDHRSLLSPNPDTI